MSNQIEMAELNPVECLNQNHRELLSRLAIVEVDLEQKSKGKRFWNIFAIVLLLLLIGSVATSIVLVATYC